MKLELNMQFNSEKPHEEFQVFIYNCVEKKCKSVTCTCMRPIVKKNSRAHISVDVTPEA
jgi:hypothetical protein